MTATRRGSTCRALRLMLFGATALAFIRCSNRVGVSDAAPDGAVDADMDRDSEPLICTTGPGVTTLYTDEDDASVPQPTIAGGQLVLATLNAVVAISTSGGDVKTLAALKYPSAPIVLDGIVYFQAIVTPDGSDSGAPQVSHAEAYSVALEGGTPTPMPAFGSLIPAASDGSSLYLEGGLGLGIQRWTPPSSTLVAFPEDTLSIDAIAVQGDYIYVAAQDVSVGGFGNGVIARVLKTGDGTVERIVANIGHPWNLAADDNGLYWVESPQGLTGPSHLVRSNLDGTMPTALLQGTFLSLVAANGVLYFSTGTEIASISPTGGVVASVASGLTNAGLLVITNGNAIWIDPVNPSLSGTVPVVVNTACIVSR